MRWPAPLQRVPASRRTVRVPGRSPPEPVERSSPGLAALFGALDPAIEQHVLDLGAASGANLAVYSCWASQVRFAALLSDQYWGAGQVDQSAAVADFATTLNSELTTYTLIVAWDVLDYLPHEPRRALVAHLAASSAPEARLYAVVSESDTMPAEPGTFVLCGTDRIAQHSPPPVPRPSPRLRPAEVERTLHPFVVGRSFVLRNGTREYVAVLAR